MLHFRYTALDGKGQVVRGMIEAADKAAALDALRGQGLRPSLLDTGGGFGARMASLLHADLSLPGLSGSALSRNELIQILDELALLAGEGVNLKQALGLCADLRADGPARKLVRDLEEDLTAGRSLSDAMDARGAAFPAFVRAMVRAGEESGALEEVLAATAGYLKRDQEVRRRIVSALTYPAILLLVTVASIILLLTVVVPQFEPIFRSAGANLPAATQFLISAADGLSAHGPLLAIIGLGLLIGGLFAARDEAMAARFSRWLNAVPWFGPLREETASARFARTLAVTLGNGMALLRALQVCTETAVDPFFRARLRGVMESVRKGSRLGPAFEAEDLGADVLRKLIILGEQSGRHADMLSKAADLLDQKIRRRIDSALALMVPAVTLIMGLVVGGAMYAIFAAVFSVNTLV